MADPITDAELDDWERIYQAFRSALESAVTYDAAYFEKSDAFSEVAEDALPRLIAEHRKLRAHIIDTVGEDGLAELLSND